MQTLSFYLALALMSVFLVNTGCEKRGPEISPEYASEIAGWEANRLKSLKHDRGWPSLVGLHWLTEGVQSFGCSSDMQITINGIGPDSIGVWTLEGDSVLFVPFKSVVVKRDSVIFTGGIVRSDRDDSPDLFNLDNLYWTLIYRGDKYGVRIWDTLSPARLSLDHISRFPLNPNLKLYAQVVDAPEDFTMSFENVLGMQMDLPIEGIVSATYYDTTFELLALDGGPDQLFLIFSDMTTDMETYVGGRYIYIPRPDNQGNTILDFNKAYNPPCAFTDFATCLLPPPANQLNIAIKAGELSYGDH